MKPPTVIDAPPSMYAFTFGLAVAVDSEPPIATAPPAMPCELASASGFALAEMCRFASACSSVVPATYALTVGFACAVAELSESATSPPDTACDVAFAVFAVLALMLTLFAPVAFDGPTTSPATYAFTVPSAFAVECAAPKPTRPPALPEAYAVAVCDEEAVTVSVPA